MANRFTVVGDLHLKNSNLDVAADLFDEIENYGLTTIWLGDMLDTKEVIRGKSLNALIEHFKHSQLHHIVLVGNHDWFNLDCHAHSLEALTLLPNVTVVAGRTEIDGMYFLPYEHDLTLLRATLDAIPDGAIVFGHFDIAGYDYGNGHIATAGLTVDELRRFKCVVSGHFHKFQTNAHLTYLGTPFTHSFGEANQSKYLAFFDPESAELETFLVRFRSHFSIDVHCDEDTDSAKLASFPIIDGDLLRVVLHGEQVNIDRVLELGRKEAEALQLNVKWVTRPSDVVLNDVQLDDTSSNEVQFTKWASEVRNLDEETVTLGLSILESVR